MPDKHRPRLSRLAQSGAAFSLVGALTVSNFGATAWAAQPAFTPQATDGYAAAASLPGDFENQGSTSSEWDDYFSDLLIEEKKTGPEVAETQAWPWAVYRCLMGIGLNGPQITQIMVRGTPEALLAAGGRAALACLRGK